MKFTDEQWREIDEARARLESYKNKIQLYPSEFQPAIKYEPILPTLRYYKPKHLSWKRVSMWSALFDEQEHRKRLERKLTEHLNASKWKRKDTIK